MMKAFFASALFVGFLVVGCEKQEAPKATIVPEEEVAEMPPVEAEPTPMLEAPVADGEVAESRPTPGERLDRAIEATGRGLQTAGEKTAEGVGTAAEKTEEALHTAGEKTEEGVKKAADATGKFLKKVGEKIEDAATREESS